MKYLLLVILFNGPGAPGIIQQEFENQKLCDTARVVMVSKLSAHVEAFCLPTGY